jgi:long-chain acyl-CoA synthetase
MDLIDNKPWINSYRLGTFELRKIIEPLPIVPLFKHLDDTAARYSSRPACFYLNRGITYKELKEYVDKLSCALADLGVQKGHRVATILPTSPQFVISDYAIQKTGAVHVPCSMFHKSNELIWEIGESGAEVIICLDSILDLINSIKDETIIKTIVVTSLQDFSAEEQDLLEFSSALQLRDLISLADAESPNVEIDPIEDLAQIIFTAGTAGKPKGLMLTHYNLTSNILQSIPWAASPIDEGVASTSSMLISLPAFQASSHLVIRTCVYWGLQMLMVPDFRDIDAIVELLKNFRPVMAPLVPTQYMQLIDGNKIAAESLTQSDSEP